MTDLETIKLKQAYEHELTRVTHARKRKDLAERECTLAKEDVQRANARERMAARDAADARRALAAAEIDFGRAREAYGVNSDNGSTNGSNGVAA